MNNNLDLNMDLYNDSDMCAIESEMSLISYAMESAAFEIEMGNEEFIPVYEAAKSKASTKMVNWLNSIKAKAKLFARKMADAIKKFIIKLRIIATKKKVGRISNSLYKDGSSGSGQNKGMNIKNLTINSNSNVNDVSSLLDNSYKYSESNQSTTNITSSNSGKKSISGKKIAGAVLISAAAATVVAGIIANREEIAEALKEASNEIDEYFGYGQYANSYEDDAYESTLPAFEAKSEEKLMKKESKGIRYGNMVKANASELKRAGDIIIYECNELLDFIDKTSAKLRKHTGSPEAQIKSRKKIMQAIDEAMKKISKQTRDLTDLRMQSIDSDKKAIN